jgi:hypothetical protein
MQLDVAADTQCDEQLFRIPAITMVDDQAPAGPAGPAGPAALLIPLKHRFPQAAEPAPRMVIPLIAEAAAAEDFQLNRAAPAGAE